MQPTYRKEKDKMRNTNKPLPPKLKAQLTLHKPDIPNRPVINNMNAPTYKVPKYLVSLHN